jgi:tricorn protease
MLPTVRALLPLVTSLALITASTPCQAIEAPFPRHPSPSPDGSLIAFSWQGDLWLVPRQGGQARRLTVHPATERYPVWSRDGRWIAFASDRYGNADVYVLPADGSGPPRRLTVASVSDRPVDFTPDGTEVAFVSSRAEGIRWMPALYTVPVAGGTPRMAQSAFTISASYSPDGTSVAMVRGATPWTRSGYRGSANRDVWVRTADSTYVQLTDFDGEDDCPGWIDDRTLVMLSGRDGRKNLYRLDLTSGDTMRLTAHDGSDARWPRVAANGSLVAYEYEDAIWAVPGAGGEPTRLAIEVPPDLTSNPIERRVATSDAEELAVHPTGKLAAIIVHGDVFVVEISSKEDQEVAPPTTRQVTSSPGREQDLSWSPDGKALLFASERNGSFDLFLARPSEPEVAWTDSFDFDLTRLSDSAAEETHGRFSPDGSKVVFIRGKGDLVVCDADGGHPITLLEHWSTPDFDWSPDGQWLTYSVTDEHYNSEVWIIRADGTGEAPYNVSRHPDDDLMPRFSPDGKRLVWASRRHADTLDLWSVWLTRADYERSPADWLKLWRSDEDKDEEDAESDCDSDDAETEKALPKVTIEWEGLWERARPLTSALGDESSPVVTPKGRTILLTAEPEGERDLYRVRWNGKDLKRLTTGGLGPHHIQLDCQGKTVFFLDEKGTVRRVDLDGKEGDPTPFAARYEVDRQVDRAVVFDEAWRALNAWFYDPGFHGVDWRAAWERYRPWALAASTETDFSDVVNLMLGELNASHMGYYHRRRGDGEETGWIGAFFEPDSKTPGVIVREVLRNSPAARSDVGLKPGDHLLSVNGRMIEPDTNVYELFADTAVRTIPITFLNAEGTTRHAEVTPVSFAEHEQLRYEHWVHQRREMVDALSGGRLGYIHIQAMDMESFEVFEHALFAAGDGKEGLIIDVRSNPGGSITDYLMAVLMVRRHAFTVPRDADPDTRAYPQGRLPLSAWTRPALTLCNEDSYSNAEIFSHAFKELGRGLLVGMPTFGAVISTNGTTLLNGALVRLPMRGWYVASTGMNMENHGAQPDVVIPQPPEEDSVSTRDTQIERAVAVLLEEMKDDPRRDAW